MMDSIDIHVWGGYAVTFVIFSMIGIITFAVQVADVIEKVFQYFNNK